MSKNSQQAAQPLQAFEHLLVVDLEATCSKDGSIPREEMETIEFGAVLVHLPSLRTLREYSIFIRPRVHPVLTPFCLELTKITQAQVDAGIRFEELGPRLAQDLAPYRLSLAWGSWGFYDRNQLERDAERWRVSSPLAGIPHFNLKTLFVGGRTKGYGILNALRKIGLSFEGVHHRGIDDAKNIVRLLPEILRKQAA